ncbi:MAG: UbiD family decarboxylase [Conexivisphaerales archaeon]
MPNIWQNELNGGPYIDSGLVMLRSLKGRLNVRIYRLQIVGKNELAIMTNPISDGHYIIDEYRESGKEIPVTISIGHHPGLYVTAASRPLGFGGELDLAGYMLNEPADLVLGKSVNMPVIADSEIAIEGIIRDPSKLIDEGPFGEWPGHHLGKRMTPVIEITKITARVKPVFYDVAAARREHLVMGMLSHSVSIYNRVKVDVPDLIDLYLPASGSHRAICYLSIKKRHKGEAKRAALLTTLAYSSIKVSVVVDDDIDVRNE